MLYSNFLDICLNVLRRKGRRAKTKETRGEFNIGKTIEERQSEISTKEVFGHWELDSIVSLRGGEQSLLCNICGAKDMILCSNEDEE